MKYLSALLLSILTIAACSKSEIMTADEKAASELAERIVPEYASNLKFIQTQDSLDVFELSQEGSKVVIKGNNANSMAMGLNHYLKNYCDVSISWHVFDPIEYPSVMPEIDSAIRVEARTQERFFLNYCTFG